LQSLLNKYKDQIALGTQLLGYNARYRDDSELEQLVAELYLKAGLERWGSQYNIVLGGGFLRTRSPYNLAVGNVLYSDVQTLFTFDNPLVLCKISGYKLKTKFIQTTNEDYYVSYSQYGQTIKNSIDTNATYYVVVDSYTSQYSSNGLTEIARYDETTFARDLLADYIRAGGLAT
jgi:2',3'-cyclic-nucleotide 2'-phosphodiesterase (5'-nucleotidase family)